MIENEMLTINSVANDRVQLSHGAWSSIKSESVNISNRCELIKILEMANQEINLLNSLKIEYSILCQKYMETHNPIIAHENLHQSYWVI